MKNPSHITWKKTVLQQVDLLRTISILDEKNNKSPYNISSMIGNGQELDILIKKSKLLPLEEWIVL